MATGLDDRIAHLEGSYEQIDRRLTNVEHEVRALRGDMVAGFERTDARFERMEVRFGERFARIDARFDTFTRWFGGLMLTSWVTLMAAIFLRH